MSAGVRLRILRWPAAKGRITLLLSQSAIGPALLVAALAYALLLGLAPGIFIPPLCAPDIMALEYALNGTMLAQVFLFNPPEQIIAGWILMLVAMMAPLLIWPLAYVWKSSLPARRIRAAALFVIGYAGCWTVVGLIPITVLAVALNFFIADPILLALSGVMLAMLWRASPWQQAALNRAHVLHRIGLFGYRADHDALRFGLVHGWWCLASCWPLMLVPMLVGRYHMLAMVAAGLIALADRLRGPRKPAWRWPVKLDPVLV